MRPCRREVSSSIRYSRGRCSRHPAGTCHSSSCAPAALCAASRPPASAGTLANRVRCWRMCWRLAAATARRAAAVSPERESGGGVSPSAFGSPRGGAPASSRVKNVAAAAASCGLAARLGRLLPSDVGSAPAPVHARVLGVAGPGVQCGGRPREWGCEWWPSRCVWLCCCWRPSAHRTARKALRAVGSVQ